MSKEEKEKKWSMPFNIGYEAFQLILKAMYQQKADENPVSVSKIGSIAGLNPKTISSNMTFLKAINVIKEDTKNGFQLSKLGVDYAKAIYMKDKNAIKEKSAEIISKSHLKILSDKIELKANTITLEEIYSFIKGEGRYAEGSGITGMTPPYATGSKTLMHIFDDAGNLPDSIDLENLPEITHKQKTRKKISVKQKKQPGKTINDNLQDEDESVQSQLPSEAFGRVVVKGVGNVDITDNDTLTLAQSFMDLIKKKVEKKNKTPDT